MNLIIGTNNFKDQYCPIHGLPLLKDGMGGTTPTSALVDVFKELWTEIEK
jgi:hypothetical protein